MVDKEDTGAIVISLPETEEPSTTPPAPATSGPMVPSSNANETTLVHTDAALIYACPLPKDKGSWSHASVLGDFTASEATGAGCNVKFAFTGDSVTMYGATGTEAGVFGCSVTALASGWWNAFGTANYFVPYSGSCTLAGLGFGKHTVTMTNDPNNPKTMYFSGLRYTTNKTAVAWAIPSVTGCCATYDFPEGASTTIEVQTSSSSSSSSLFSTSGTSTTKTSTATTSGTTSTTLGGYQWETVMFLALTALAIVALASLLVGCMCCRKRDPALAPDSDEETRPLKPRAESHSRSTTRRRFVRRKGDTTSSSSSSSSGSSGDEKRRRRGTDSEE